MRRFRFVSLPVTLCLTGFLLLHAAETQMAALHALQLAATTVIPALFPFCVLSNFLLCSGTANYWGHAIQALPTKLFGLEETAGLPWLLGTLCGFPIGAIVTAQLYTSGAIQRDSAERVLALSTSVSPSFTVAIAGGVVLHDPRIGFLLWMIQVLAALLTGLFLRPIVPFSGTSINIHLESKSALASFVESVQTAARTMCHLSGFLVLFSVLLCLVTPLFSMLRIPAAASALCAGILELTNGVTMLAAVPVNLSGRFLLTSILLGFSGFCVHAQVLSFAVPLGLSIRPYLCGKVLHALLAGLLSIPALFLLPDAILPASAIQPPLSVGVFSGILSFALLSVLLFFFFLWKFGIGFGIILTKPNIKEATPMLFRDKEYRYCVNCGRAAEADDDHMLCTKKGLVEKGHVCGAFRYDPLKRTPAKAPVLRATDDMDFSL